MALLGIVFNSVRYLVAQCMHVAFAPEVRKNPTIIHAETQSDDYTGGGRNAIPKELDAGGAFKPQYVAPLRRPRNSIEAQRLYNHIRTLAFYLDAIPFLGRRLPFNVGVESILGIIPGIGDYIGLVLSLYALALSALFGLPLELLGTMFINIVVDCFLGIIPIVGDALDVAFKSNLRNLRLLEEHLIKTNGVCGAGTFSFQFPPTNEFMPPNAPARNPVAVAQSSRDAPRSSARHQAQAPAETSSRNSFLPDGTQRQGWTSTNDANYGLPGGMQDFHRGATDVHGAANCEAESVVPNEVFTTLRFEKNGISIQEMCKSLLQEMSAHGIEYEVTEPLRERGQFPLLQRHLDRLEHAVSDMKEAYPRAWSAVTYSAELVFEQVQSHLCQVEGEAQSSRRVRISISAEGRVLVTSAPIAPTGTWRNEVRLDPKVMNTGSLSPDEKFALQVKTGHRQVYDDARQRVHATLGMKSSWSRPCFDVLMQASAGDKGTVLTESSIANIIVLHHQTRTVFTPATASDGQAFRDEPPLLCGLMRQALLEHKVLSTSVLSSASFLHETRTGNTSVFLCNALRGTVPVDLVE